MNGQKSKKEVILTFRVTSAEHSKLLKLAKENGYNRTSEYIRQRILTNTSTSNRMARVDAKSLIFEINAIGKNINQIVKNNNSHFYTDYEKKKLFALMEKINKDFEKILDATI